MTKRYYILIAFILSLVSLVLNPAERGRGMLLAARISDILILLLLGGQLISGFRAAQYRRQWVIRNITLTAATLLYAGVLAFLLSSDISSERHLYLNLIVYIARSFYLLYRSFENVKSLEDALRKFNERPARSIILTFLAIASAGTLLLMLPFTTADGKGLAFIDSLFTSTSAVCVTGLIVVDTATVFSTAGKVIILALVQTGGLGIMIVTYFSMFFLRRRITIEEKKRLSFVISDNDMTGIVSMLKKIIYLTFIIEGTGAVLLFTGFGRHYGYSLQTVFLSVFHSVSAFCNAGFSLFSDSLEGFIDKPLIIFTVSILIILGGLSFAVIFNIKDVLDPRSGTFKLSLNTKVVLSWTAVLLAGGFIFFYSAEHSNCLRSSSTPVQYLSAFFQSVTLRTAGFNSVPFSALQNGTLTVMCLFMFVGAASGSTAGGIKINTLAVITAYLKSMVTNSPKVTILHYQLSKTRILRAFTVFTYGITAVLTGIAALALTHTEPLVNILFEAVSAFGTVGLSTGFTSRLNSFGKLVIICLMFNGRLGPLTILSTFSGKREKSGVEYPQGDILIG